MKELAELCYEKRVVLIGSVPPEGEDFSDFDLMVRCNDWWAIDEGRCDILFHIGASAKIKPSWLLGNDKLFTQLQLLCLFADGGESKVMEKVCEHHAFDCMLYSKTSDFLMPLRRWFETRGTSPSTGLTAAYLLCQCQPAELRITGMDIYSSEPDHVGWMKHNPIGHAEWYEKLAAMNDFLTLGDDLLAGIRFWKEGRFWKNESFDPK